ncbi:MAG: hypothetical protein VKK80_00980, partial [Prochlorothrix sp.]|nr:hypothetical protein [Prochlorothrix sp.]
MFFDDDLTGDRQPQSCAFTQTFRGKQMIKNSGFHRFRHTFTVIADADFNGVFLSQGSLNRDFLR